MMHMITRYYTVAQHTFAVEISKEVGYVELPSYEPFAV